jgi:hypothetical protein
MPRAGIFSVGTPIRDVPSSEIAPPKIRVSPKMLLIRVLLPLPFGPKMPTYCPASTLRLTSCKICSLPYPALSWLMFSRLTAQSSDPSA